MSRLINIIIFAPTIFEILIVCYAAAATKQFYFVWCVLIFYIFAKFIFKYNYVRPEHEKCE